MIWCEVMADPSLNDLPYRIELNQYGQIVMQPISNRHGLMLSNVAGLIQEQFGSGHAIVACSIETTAGVKVPDVAWMSDALWGDQCDNTPFTQAPELCIEVVSPSNSRTEMEEKIQLYFDQGAQEVWLCSEAGQLEFYAPARPLEASVLFPEFPLQIK